MARFGNPRRRSGLLAVCAGLCAPVAFGGSATPPAPHPALRIPVAALGFTGPARLYMPYRIPQMSLGYLDATHLLFTFHVARLMRRQDNDPPQDLDQTIHAVVLSLPAGKVVHETEWRLHDRDRYLWMLGNGAFLLRERDDFFVGDSSLHLKPYLAAQGTFVFGSLSPGRSTFEAEYSSLAPTAASEDNQPTLAPTLGSDAPRFSARRHIYTMLIVDTANHTAKRVDNLNRPIDLTLMPGGYLTAEPGKAHDWDLQANPWQGAPHTIAHVSSSCRPLVDSLSASAFLVSTCQPFTDNHIVQAFSLDGKPLWQQMWQSRFTWGTYAYSTSGTRFAYGSFEMDHTLSAPEDAGEDSILGEPVGVFETDSGKLDMVLDATPIMTGAGNFALSPDGDQLAILRDGAIEVYDLPPVAVPGTTAHR